MNVDDWIEKGRKITVLVVQGLMVIVVVGFAIYSLIKIFFG